MSFTYRIIDPQAMADALEAELAELEAEHYLLSVKGAEDLLPELEAKIESLREKLDALNIEK